MSASPLEVIWDLQHWPVNFECLWQFIQANEHRKQLGLEKMKLIVLKGERRKFGSKEAFSEEENEHRLKNLLIPCTELLPAFEGWELFDRKSYRKGEHVFPPGWESPNYHLRAYINDHRWFWQRDMERLRAPQWALDYADLHLGDERPIVVALRANSHSGWRNSNAEAWQRFAESRDNVILLPDAMSPCGDDFISRCSRRIPERAALYSRAKVVGGVAGGNMALAMFLGCKTVWFDTHQPDTDTSEKAYRERGMIDLPDTTFASLDSFETIMKEMEPWLD
jgi:hypothetical protein